VYFVGNNTHRLHNVVWGSEGSVCCDNRTKHTLFGQNSKFFNVNVAGTHSNDCVSGSKWWECLLSCMNLQFQLCGN
jgi:hypothetical protein